MPRQLAYDPHGRFRILQLTDLHYEDGGPKDQRMLRLVSDLIAWEQPHLVFITGDFNTNARSLPQTADVLKPITDSGVPFCYIFGNHDAEYGAKHPALVKALHALPGCINPPSARGIPGYSNFVLSVEDEWLLVGLDSGMYNQDPRVGGYDYVKPKQIAWYSRQLQDRSKAGGGFGALCFLHIPLPEYAQAWKHGRRIGTRLEDECHPDQNSGLYSAMLQDGHTRGVFAGHDHLNDYCASLHGIALCYGRAGGFSTYGRRTFPKGGRVIELTKGCTDAFESWVRLSDGTVKDRFFSRDQFAENARS